MGNKVNGKRNRSEGKGNSSERNVNRSERRGYRYEGDRNKCEENLIEFEDVTF